MARSIMRDNMKTSLSHVYTYGLAFARNFLFSDSIESHCSLCDARAPVDSIYVRPTFKWVAETEVNDSVQGE